MISAFANRRVSKSKFSMYLRTQCDRELYLSLFSNRREDLEEAGLPVPLKSRPGVQLITTSGRAFELEQFNLLCASLPSNVFHKNSGAAKVDLAEALKKSAAPTFILQPEFEPETFREFALESLGVKQEDLAHIPELADLRPDIVFVHGRLANDYEILSDGSRRLVADDDKRIALSVIDLKNITEANASYSAEVCLYAIFLSSWLHTVGKEFLKTHFVSDRVYLWKHVEMPTFTKVMATREGGDHAKRLLALAADLKDGLVKYLVYMPSVRQFFAEVLPRVVRQGDEHGWASVDYHVNPRCSSCDWLGNKLWLSPDDKKLFEAHPEHYCTPAAKAADHLSQMPSLSKGASQVLHGGGHKRVANVVGMQPHESILRAHALLKKDRGQIGARAASISSGDVSIDQVAKVGGLAKTFGAEFDVIVNFDAGSGFLTGVAIRGALFSPYGRQFPTDDGKGQSIMTLGEAAFVINKDTVQAEWAALSAFIDKFAGWLDLADKLFNDLNFDKVRTQLFFWEVRQYEELCNAFGRHLLDVLELPDRSQRALAWIFPPEELLEKSDHICPNIVFLRDIVTSSVRSPQPFAVTLLGTADRYHHERLTPRRMDSYYVEPLGNSVPRERIFEIWKSTTGTVRMFGRLVSVTEAIDRYGNALKAHSWALASIAARLRTDLKDCISGKAPELSLTIPTGLSGVAYDSKLWARWADVSAAVARTEALGAFITRVEWLEASYKAIVLTKLIKDHGSHRYEFEVSDDSTEAKIEEGDWCALGIVDWPGFPLEKPINLDLAQDDRGAYAPMHAVMIVKIETFERVAKRIIVLFEPAGFKMQAVFDAVMESGVIPIGAGQLYLLDRMPFDDSRETTEILKAIGDPACASISTEARQAMGTSTSKKIAKGKGPCSPVARVLWEGDKLSQASVRSSEAIAAITKFAKDANAHPLNDSQVAAVQACAERQLSIVWGPPGTGKTDTLVAFLHAVVREGKHKNILVTGPNYRTVEELAMRLAKNLDGDRDATCDFFWLYSKSRLPKELPGVGDHFRLKTVTLDKATEEFEELAASIADPSRTTIVSTTAHMVYRTAKALDDGSQLTDAFDLVVIDESSQVPVTLALKPLTALKATGQVIVAGDHMQMPPIQRLEPPKGAEYLVDSIQKYLIRRFDVPQQALLVNYRSNQDLVDYAKSLGYPAGLKAQSAKKDLQLIAPLYEAETSLPSGLPKTPAYTELAAPERRVTALIHDDAVSSQANELEAGLVAGLAYVLRHSVARELNTGVKASVEPFSDDEFFETGIGIVTPHKAQKALVIRKLIDIFPKADPQKVFDAVDTVERFQGGERNTIIVSFGVGDTDIIEGEEAFLLQLERTNVAVSRAKAKCIMMMPRSLAYHLPTDQKAADTSVALKAYLEEFCSNRKAIEIESGGIIRKAEVRWH